MNTVLCVLMALAAFDPILYGVSQDHDKYQLDPTPDPTAKYKVYVPLTLEDPSVS